MPLDTPSSTDDTLAAAARFGLPPPRFQTLRTVTALMLREMGSTYGRSPGGYIWAIIEPIAVIALMAVAFALVVRAPSLGTSFILFYATAYLPYSLYQDIADKMNSALRYSRSLLAYPRVTWMDAILARFALNVITGLTVFCILMVGILNVIETRSIISVGPILIGLTLAALLGMGVGLMNCLISGLYPVWAQIWSIVSRPLFLGSGIFYTYEDMPSVAQNVLWWNPVLHATSLVRSGFYPTYAASFVSVTFCLIVAGVMIAMSILFLRNTYQTILER